MTVLLIFIVSGCSSFRQSDTLIKLDQLSHFRLQAVPAGLLGRGSLQKLVVSSPDEHHEFLLQTELRESGIKMVGLTPSGMVLFSMVWSTGTGLEIESKIDIKELKPEVMLAYYQMSQWPLENVQEGMSGLSVSVSPTNSQVREFFHNDTLIFSVLREQSGSQMLHFRDNYQIDIDTLQQTQLKD